MMPAEFVSSAVSMFANTLPQFFDLGDQFIPCHAIEIFIHSLPPV